MPKQEHDSARRPIVESEALDKMVVKSRNIADILKAHMGEIRIVSHHDADGICSAAIIARALAREGKPFHLSFIKQLYEDVIKELANEEHRLIVFLDMGSGQLEMIQEHLLNGNTKIVVLDHHRMQGEITSDDLIHLNPVEYGIEENISGSGTSYIVARAINPGNRELSQLAIIGAIGDSQIGAIGSHWGLFGLNKEILKDAESTGKIRVSKGLRLWGRTTRPIHKALEYSMDPYIPGISGSESGAVHFLQELGIEIRNKDGSWKSLSSLTKPEMKKLTTGIIKERIRENHDNPEWVFGEVYDLLDKDELKDANEFATILNSAGKQDMGYVGVALCLNNKEYHPLVEKMLSKYRREIGKSLRWVEKNPESIRTTDNANYVLAGSSIPETIISNVVSIMHRSDMLPETEKDKPVFALVNKESGDIKVSARASDQAVENGLSLQEVLSGCVSIIGGEGGGHAGAAGASIPKGSEESFINSIEEILMKLKTDDNKKIDSEVEKDGTAKSEGGSGRGSEGSQRGQEGAAKAVAPKAKKEAEGEGLVRYLGS
jgi:RecJ-like exonuclease